jgi:hypothetical protein
MPIMFRNGKPLFVNGLIAMDEMCCCAQCAYSVHVSIDWDNNADLDLYGSVDGGYPTYYANTNYNGLALSVDAHPVCYSGPMPPEEITGDFTHGHTFRFWYNQYSPCETETPPGTHHIQITNTGPTPICVNGQTVDPGDSWDSDTIAYAGYGMGSAPYFPDGTVVEVICGSCA